MDRIIEGVVNVVCVPMVASTDFATPISNLSNILNVSLYGTVAGDSGVYLVAAGTGSLAASGRDFTHIGPSATGLYAVRIGPAQMSDASNAIYDQLILHASATGAARQTMIFSVVRVTASDILSTMGSQFAVVSNYLSNTSNYLSSLSAIASDAYSAAAQANSRVLVVQSAASDAASGVTVLQTRTTTIVSDLSDLMSRTTQINSRVSDLNSDLRSLMTTTGILLDASTLSDLRSAIAAGGGTVNVSNISDIASAIWGYPLTSRVVVLSPSDLSDLRSAIAAGTAATITASDISDIASAVWAHTVGTRVDSRVLRTLSDASDLISRTGTYLSDMSDLLSRTTQINSRVSDLNSDLRSLMTTTGVQLNASTLSDLRSAITAITATLSASDLSDLRSAIAAGPTGWASDLSDILSAARAAQSLASDTYSLLNSRVPDITTTGSDLVSAIWAYPLASKVVALSASDLSDLRSAMAAGPTNWASDVSDLLSRTTQINSRVLLAQSAASDAASGVTVLQTRTATLVSDVSDLMSRTTQINSRVSDLNSDLRSLMTTTGVQLNASTLSDLRSAVNAVTVNLTASDISDIASAVAAAVTVITPSDISDIASAVWAHATGTQVNSRALRILSDTSDLISRTGTLASDMSDLLSRTTQINSRVSDLNSDLRSLMTTTGVQLNASMLSDLRSAMAAGPTNWASDVSDLLSRTSQINSRVILTQSQASNTYSYLSDLMSDLRSVVTTTGVQLNASTLSDLRSAITAAAVTLDASTLSDIASQVWAHAVGTRLDSRVALIQSDVSDATSAARQAGSRASTIYELLSDVDSAMTEQFAYASGVLSDLDSRVPGRVLVRADTMAELTGAPSATPTYEAAMMLLFQRERNNTTVTTTTRKIRNAAGTVIASATIGDNTTSFVQGTLA